MRLPLAGPSRPASEPLRALFRNILRRGAPVPGAPAVLQARPLREIPASVVQSLRPLRNSPRGLPEGP
eukprot:6874852-Pyramimonas_sp.AAC.1